MEPMTTRHREGAQRLARTRQRPTGRAEVDRKRFAVEWQLGVARPSVTIEPSRSCPRSVIATDAERMRPNNPSSRYSRKLTATEGSESARGFFLRLPYQQTTCRPGNTSRK